MKVGDVQETIVVTGATPVVDIQNVNQIRVITQDVLESIPTGRGYANYATLIPGVTMSNSSLNISQDVGGGTGYNFDFAAIHGGKAMDQQVMVNGMSVTSLTGTGGDPHELVRRHRTGVRTAAGCVLRGDPVRRHLHERGAKGGRQPL